MRKFSRKRSGKIQNVYHVIINFPALDFPVFQDIVGISNFFCPSSPYLIHYLPCFIQNTNYKIVHITVTKWFISIKYSKQTLNTFVILHILWADPSISSGIYIVYLHTYYQHYQPTCYFSKALHIETTYFINILVE